MRTEGLDLVRGPLPVGGHGAARRFDAGRRIGRDPAILDREFQQRPPDLQPVACRAGAELADILAQMLGAQIAHHAGAALDADAIDDAPPDGPGAGGQAQIIMRCQVCLAQGRDGAGCSLAFARSVSGIGIGFEKGWVVFGDVGQGHQPSADTAVNIAFAVGLGDDLYARQSLNAASHVFSPVDSVGNASA